VWWAPVVVVSNDVRTTKENDFVVMLCLYLLTFEAWMINGIFDFHL
jgi:hypothetical protein